MMNAEDQGVSPFSILLIAIAALLGVAAMTAALIISETKMSVPRLGDLAEFHVPANAGEDDGVAVSAELAIQPGPGAAHAKCTLDAYTMAKAGGSLLVVGREGEPDGRFLVHWAGGATAKGRNSCGTSADLLVSRRGLEALLDSSWSSLNMRRLARNPVAAAAGAA
jgi:hypothetical protein